ncbi:MAG: hypothetical protein K2J10_12215 [Muribaculaceae bacterium]|nr:hypothetical protein [Muribaculaceae bacterium]
MTYNFVPSKRFFSDIKTSVYLFKDIWKEGTTALVHSPRAVNKTSFALPIADEIASKGRDVLYINAEQNLANYNTNSDNLYIFTPEFESIDDKTDYADLVFQAIEHAVRTTSIRTFVIDSVSRIAALSFGRNASQSYIMKRLVALQVKCKLSLLVLADETTKSSTNALIALAATEFGLQPSEESIKKSGNCKLDNNPEFDSSQSVTDTPREAFQPLTRQQRRALARQRAKSTKAYVNS